MKILLKIFYLLILLNGSKNLTINEMCQDISIFNKENKNSLRNLSLRDFFNEFELFGNGESRIKVDDFNGKDIVIKKENISVNDPQEEIEILNLLKDKNNFVTLLNCVLDEKNKNVYLFFEKLKKDLFKKNTKEFKDKKGLKERLEFYIKLAKILKELHKIGYIHGEITPYNIMTTSDNFDDIKLIDFDSSTKIGKNSKGGCDLTNSPEKYLNINTTSNPSLDIYSFGMTILAIELGKKHLMQIFKKSWGVTTKSTLAAIRDTAVEKIKTIYTKKINESSTFTKIIRWIKSWFMDNRIERIEDFGDLLKNMMDGNMFYRLDLDNIIEIMKKISDLHENNDKITIENSKISKIDPEFEKALIENLNEDNYLENKKKLHKIAKKRSKSALYVIV